MILLAWGLLFFEMDASRKALLCELKREQNNLARVLADHLYKIMGHKQAIEVFALQFFTGQKEKSLSDITGFLHGEKAFTRVVLYDLSGTPFYMSSPGKKNHAQSQKIRQIITNMVENKNTLLVELDRNTVGISWQIPFLFPLRKGNEMTGAMLLELDLGYFLNLLKNIDIGKTGKIMIFNDHGEELARFENGGLAIGHSFPKPLLNKLLIQDSSGTFKDPGLDDFHLTCLHVQKYPFVVTVSREMKDFFSEFTAHKNKLLWALSFISIFCLSVMFLLFKEIVSNNRYLNALILSNRKNKNLILRLEKEHKVSTKAASVDALTQLYNRRFFVSMAQKNLFLAKRNSFSCAILFIDLDRFKKINDTLGHRVGDLLLKKVAHRLIRCTRKSDIVSRFGGDEFVVMLTKMSAEENISPVVEKIIAAVSAPYEYMEGHQIITSPSIGIAVYPRDGEDIDTLIIHADAAMYKSKKSGRGRYFFFDASLNTISLEKFELEQRMPSAINDKEFVLYYQPKLRLEDYRVVGLEALIRWQHPDHHLIYPADFIEIAEETGLIVDLDAWVLETACRQITQWAADGLNPVPISINVSPIELKDRAYSRRFLKVLERYGLSTESIEIEITESAFIEDREMVISNLETLFSQGVKITLDDFGKGFSNLDHIRSLPITSLKIDKSFIKDIFNSENECPIVTSTISLAQKLEMTVVAEGIETHGQLINLKVAGCNEGQGYFFSRPVSEKKIREFIMSPIRGI